MNERIKELADQIFSMERFEYADEFISDEFMEKFAELIVKECTDLFEVEYGQSEVSGNEVANVLKRHFGVEE